MKKAKAIELLKLAVPIKALTWQEYADFVEAVNMGMDALKAQLSQEGTTSDMVSRQEALDALRKCQTYLYDARDPELKIELSSAEAAINNLPPAQPEPQWIPVSERLPETGGEYLVSVRWYREDDIDIDVYDYDARCKEWNDGESCGQRVIAWMPLPVVYKPNK